MVFKTPQISLRLFQWHKESNTFTADASDLTGQFAVGRVWDDAADVGFTMTSPSGKSIAFVESHNEVSEGDLLWIEYKPINPKDGDFKVKIYND